MTTLELAADAEGLIKIAYAGVVIPMGHAAAEELGHDLRAILDYPRTYRTSRRDTAELIFEPKPRRIYLIHRPTNKAIVFSLVEARAILNNLPRFIALARALAGVHSPTARRCDALLAAGFHWHLVNPKKNIGHWGRGKKFGPNAEYVSATEAAFNQFISTQQGT